MQNAINLAGGVLAGGKGSRMGNVDKAFLMWNGQPFIYHTVKALSASVEDIFISRQAPVDLLSPHKIESYGLTAFDHEGYGGPIAGLLACLKEAAKYQYKALVITPCDTPLLQPSWPERLIRAWQHAPHKPHVVFDGQRLQPLHMVIATHYIEPLQDHLLSNRRSMQSFLNASQAEPVDYSDCADQFLNINTANQLDDISH